MKYKFLFDIAPNQVDSVLAEYEPTPWTIKNFGQATNGKFWILLETVFNPNG